MPSWWLELAEVLLAQPVERRAVELRRAADEVVDLRLERLALLVVPRVRRDVAVVDEHVLREPVLRLARQPVAALEQQDPLARTARGAARACRRPRPVPMMITSCVVRLSPLSTRSISSGDDDPRRGLHQRQVRERLREVAEVAAGVGVELLGVEAERRGDPQQPLHQVARPLQLADDRERRDEPERADQERALLARTARRRSRRCGSAGRSRPRSARRRSRARSRAGARRRRAGSSKIAASSAEASSASVS